MKELYNPLKKIGVHLKKNTLKSTFKSRSLNFNNNLRIIIIIFGNNTVIIKINYFKKSTIKIDTIVKIIKSKKIHNFHVLLNNMLIFSRGSVALIAIIHTQSHSILKKVRII